MSIIQKTTQEIEAMRKGGKILGEILYALEHYLEPGMSTLDLEHKAEELFSKYGVKPGFKGYHGYPSILCTSVNNEVVHSIPNNEKMEKGDIISIDCGVELEGLNTDSAVALVVGNETIPEVQKFVDTCKRAMWAGIKMAKSGNRIGDISSSIQKVVEEEGYTVIPELTGHGIGYSLHEEPYVPNHGTAGTGPILIENMTIAIEPIISMGSPKIDTLDDEWTIMTRDGSLAIQHEHTILITKDKPEILTLRPEEKTLGF